MCIRDSPHTGTCYVILPTFAALVEKCCHQLPTVAAFNEFPISMKAVSSQPEHPVSDTMAPLPGGVLVSIWLPTEHAHNSHLFPYVNFTVQKLHVCVCSLHFKYAKSAL